MGVSRSPPEARAGAGSVRATGDETRSNRQARHAVYTCGPSRPRGCLALACGSHLGQRPCGRANRPDTRTLSTRSQSPGKTLEPQGPSTHGISIYWLVLSSLLAHRCWSPTDLIERYWG